MKKVRNTQQLQSEEFETLRSLCKHLKEKVNIETKLTKTATASGEVDDPYTVKVTAFKPSTSSSNDNFKNIIVNPNIIR